MGDQVAEQPTAEPETTTGAEVPAADTKAAAPATNPEATETIKVDGKEYKVTKAQLIALAQKGHFADKKLQSMAVLQSKTNALIQALKTPEGLISILKDPALGANPADIIRKLISSDLITEEVGEDLAKWVYEHKVRTAQMTPEQLEQEKKLTDYERLKKAEDDRKAQEVTAKQQEQINAVYQQIRSEVTKQILADKTFPQTEGSIRQVVEKLRVMNKQGAAITTENITRAISLVKKDHMTHQTALLDAMNDPEGLIAAIGEERALKISKALVARLQAKQAASGKAKSEPKSEGEDKELKTTERIDRKLGKTPQGYSIMKF